MAVNFPIMIPISRKGIEKWFLGGIWQTKEVGFHSMARINLQNVHTHLKILWKMVGAWDEPVTVQTLKSYPQRVVS